MAKHSVCQSNIVCLTNYNAKKVTYFDFFLLQLYELDDNPDRKEFLDNLFTFMQQRGKDLQINYLDQSKITHNKYVNDSSTRCVAMRVHITNIDHSPVVFFQGRHVH